MRILHLSESDGWSGGTAQLLLLASGLKARGHECVVGAPDHSELRRRGDALSLPHLPFSPFQDYDLASAWRLARAVRELKPDVVHAHHSRAHAVALLALLLVRSVRPVFVVTRRVSFPIPRNPFSRFKYTCRRIDGLIAVADSIRGALVRGGVGPERVAVIRSGTVPADFTPRAPSPRILAELGARAGVPVIGKVANFSAWKGQEVFLRAAAELRQRGLEAVYVLAGRGTDSGELRARAEALGLGPDEVRFLGFRTDVPDLLSAFTLSVNAAVDGEGIPGTLRESLALGVPVVASEVGGNRELVRSGETGELFPRGDARALADRVELLLRDRERARRQAAAGRALVLRELSDDAMVERTLAYYQRLLPKPY